MSRDWQRRSAVCAICDLSNPCFGMSESPSAARTTRLGGSRRAPCQAVVRPRLARVSSQRRHHLSRGVQKLSLLRHRSNWSGSHVLDLHRPRRIRFRLLASGCPFGADTSPHGCTDVCCDGARWVGPFPSRALALEKEGTASPDHNSALASARSGVKRVGA